MKALQDLGIEHVGFVVRNLEAAITHFTEYYRIDGFKHYDFVPDRAWSYGREVGDYRLKIAMSSVADRSSGVEIIQPVSGEGVHRDFMESGHSGLHHIAFKVDDYEYWRRYFIGKKARFVFESETEDAVIGYRRCFYAEDPATEMIYEIKEQAYFRQ